MVDDGKIYDVFVSYSRIDEPWVEEVVKQLNELGIRVFYDGDIDPGADFERVIEDALKLSRNVLLVITPQSAASDWVTLEVAMAIASNRSGSNLRLIPLLLEPTDPSMIRLAIQRLSFVDLTDARTRQNRYHHLVQFLQEQRRQTLPAVPERRWVDKNKANDAKMDSGDDGVSVHFLEPSQLQEGNWKKRECEFAITALEAVRGELDSLFSHGNVTNEWATAKVPVDGNPQPVNLFAYHIAPKLCASLRDLSEYPVWNALDETTRPEAVVSPADHIWVADALDGARHVLKSFPFYSTTFALVQRENGMPVVGMTYLPWTGEKFFAYEGGGTYLNDWNRKMELKDTPEFRDASVYVEFPNAEKVGEDVFADGCEILKRVFSEVKRARGMSLGSFGLAYIAKGVFDAYLDLSYTSRIHNMAAGCLLVDEANGCFEILTNQMQSRGNRHRCLAAGSQKLMGGLKEMMAVL